MTSKKLGMVAGGALAGTLLLGTAGLVAAQDPTASPSTGPGMMGGSGMMGGAGMMGGQMGSGTMSSEQLAQMNALHDQMVESGVCDPAQMQQLHAQHHPSN